MDTIDIGEEMFIKGEGQCLCVDLHPTEEWLLVSGDKGMVHIWNYLTSIKMCSLRGGSGRIQAKFIARERLIITGSQHGEVRVFRYAKMVPMKATEIIRFLAHSHHVRAIVVHPTESWILTAGYDRTIKLWDWSKRWSGKQVFTGHTGNVMALALHPTDPLIFASAAADDMIRVWRIGEVDSLYTLRGHQDVVVTLHFYTMGEKCYLISGGFDQKLRVWDYEKGWDQDPVCVLIAARTSPVYGLWYLPNNSLTVIGSRKSPNVVFQSVSMRYQSLDYDIGDVWSLTALGDSSVMAIGGSEGFVVLRLTPKEKNPTSGEILSELWETRRFADCFVVAGRDLIPVHQWILLAACPNFKKMIIRVRGQRRLVLDRDVRPQVVCDLLAYIYQGTVNNKLSTESVRELLIVTNEIGITGLQDALEKIMAQRLDTNTFIEVVKLAHGWSFNVLMQACVEFFSQHHRNIVISEQWRHLASKKGELVATLLQSALYREKGKKLEDLPVMYGEGNQWGLSGPFPMLDDD